MWPLRVCRLRPASATGVSAWSADSVCQVFSSHRATSCTVPHCFRLSVASHVCQQGALSRLGATGARHSSIGREFCPIHFFSVLFLLFFSLSLVNPRWSIGFSIPFRIRPLFSPSFLFLLRCVTPYDTDWKQGNKSSRQVGMLPLLPTDAPQPTRSPHFSQPVQPSPVFGDEGARGSRVTTASQCEQPPLQVRPDHCLTGGQSTPVVL